MFNQLLKFSFKFSAAFFIVMSSLTANAADLYPKILKLSNGELTVYQPQIETWKDYREIIGWVAVVLKPNGAEAITGALKVQAMTDVNHDERMVVAYNKKILDLNFPTLGKQKASELKVQIEKAISKAPEIIPLDLVLAAVGKSEKRTKSVKISKEIPNIFYSSNPAILVLFDGEPKFAKIKDNSLEFAVNTNWDIFHDEGKSKYYLRNDKYWLAASHYEGPWVATTDLPEDLAELPSDKNWKAVLEAIPAEVTPKDKQAVVKISTRPAELIVTTGEAELIPIKDTNIFYVINTSSDLFFHKVNQQYYFLVSGRWFNAKSLSGPWDFSMKVPDDFSRIPADHEKAAVRASVPGTEEADLAVLLAQVPRKATVNIANTTVDVVYTGNPIFEDIGGTSLKYAVNTQYDVIQAGNTYFLCHNGVWFMSADPNGPWKVTDKIPKEIYEIPSDSPMYHVTYVEIYDSTKTTVTVGYTSGYHNTYFSWGVMMYGTGYYYDPYWYYDPFNPYYPIYYSYYPSYGVAAYYNPYTGTYGRGAYVYGPYGGYGRGASYNPKTGTYSRGAAAWGSSEGIYARQAYNPKTGIAAQTIQSTNSYAHWGDTVVRRGDDWIKTSHYTDAKGSKRTLDTSRGTKGIQYKGQEHKASVVRGKEGDLYVGKDGQVFKRSDDGWMKRDGNDWQAIDKSIDRGAVQDKFNERGITQESLNDAYSSRSNIEKLNRDYNTRSQGNQRFNDYQSYRQSGSFQNRRNYGGGGFSGGGGRFRR